MICILFIVGFLYTGWFSNNIILASRNSGYVSNILNNRIPKLCKDSLLAFLGFTIFPKFKYFFECVVQ